MPADGRPLERLGFLTIGSFDPADPASGHEETLRVVERAEALGYDSAWLRHRHLQHGISSPVAVMAAASQRTSRIALGTAVTPIGAENPFRLAEDLGTVDVLLGGRLNPGFSVGTPMHFDLYREAIYPDTAEHEDLGNDRLLRFRDLVRGDPVTDAAERRGIEEFATTVQPQSPGLADRLWYGTGSTGPRSGQRRTGSTCSRRASREPRRAPTSRRTNAHRSTPTSTRTRTRATRGSRRA